MAKLRGHKRWEEIVSEFEEHLFGLGKAQNSTKPESYKIPAYIFQVEYS